MIYHTKYICQQKYIKKDMPCKNLPIDLLLWKKESCFILTRLFRMIHKGLLLQI